MSLNLLKKDEFIAYIEQKVVEEKSSYLDAILVACEEFEIAPEGCKNLLPRPMVEQLEVDFMDINMIKPDPKIEFSEFI